MASPARTPRTVKLRPSASTASAAGDGSGATPLEARRAVSEDIRGRVTVSCPESRRAVSGGYRALQWLAAGAVGIIRTKAPLPREWENRMAAARVLSIPTRCRRSQEVAELAKVARESLSTRIDADLDPALRRLGGSRVPYK